MNAVITKTQKQIIVEFAEYCEKKDYEALKDLLAEAGEFEIQNDQLEIVDAGKEEFIKWFTNKLEQTTIIKIGYDQCMHCFIGDTIVLINDGWFPLKHKEDSERSKAAIMVRIENDRIYHVKFCYVFLHAENKFMFELISSTTKEFMDEGYDFDDAYSFARRVYEE